jgi:hypothetical protein
MHVFKNVFGDFQEDDIILEVLLVKLVRADTQDDEAYVRWMILLRLYLSTTGVSVVRET